MLPSLLVTNMTGLLVQIVTRKMICLVPENVHTRPSQKLLEVPWGRDWVSKAKQEIGISRGAGRGGGGGEFLEKFLL